MNMNMSLAAHDSCWHICWREIDRRLVSVVRRMDNEPITLPLPGRAPQPSPKSYVTLESLRNIVSLEAASAHLGCDFLQRSYMYHYLLFCS